MSAETFGVKVRELRKARGWTQTKLMDELGLLGIEFTQTIVSKIEGADRPTSVDEVTAIATLFGVTFNTLLGDEPISESALARLRKHAEADGLSDTFILAKPGDTVLIRLPRRIPAAEQARIAKMLDPIKVACFEPGIELVVIPAAESSPVVPTGSARDGVTNP